jgi:long-subunit fatty acid transport protein
MKNHLIFVLIITALVFNFAFSQTAEDAVRIFNNQIGFGTRALGMGGAFVGVAEDYSATFWNPAGLSQIRRMEFWTGISHHAFENDLQFNESTTPNSKNATKFNSIGMVFPIPTRHGRLALALGYQKLNNFEKNQNYVSESVTPANSLIFQGLNPQNPSQSYNFYGEKASREGQLSYNGSINQFSLASALGVSDRISFGFAINFWSGKNDFSYSFSQKDVFDAYSTPPANFDQYTQDNTTFSRYSSFNAKFGTLINFGRVLRIGFGVDTPQKFYVKEEEFLNQALSFDDGSSIEFQDSLSRKSEIEYELIAPFRLSVGSAISLGRILLLTGSAEYLDWTQFKFETKELISLNKTFNQKYRPTLKVRLGAELGLPIFDSQVRAGLIYDPTPIKGFGFDYDRKYATAGFGFLIDKLFKIDMAYMLGFWKELSVDNLTPEGTDLDLIIHQFFINFSIRI